MTTDDICHICHVSNSLSLSARHVNLHLPIKFLDSLALDLRFRISSAICLISGVLRRDSETPLGMKQSTPLCDGLMMFDSCDLGSPVHTSSEHFVCDCRTLTLSKMGPEKKTHLKACNNKSKHHRSAPMSAKRKSDSSCILRISDGFASFTVSLRFSFPSAFAAFPSCHGPMMHKHQRLIYGEKTSRKPHAQSPNHQNLRWCFDLIKNEGCRVVIFHVIHLLDHFLSVFTG